MREIGLVLMTCVIGWTLAAGVGSVQEMRRWAAIDRAARAQAELSAHDIRGGVGVELSPAIR
jgi:hypothetical protein